MNLDKNNSHFNHGFEIVKNLRKVWPETAAELLQEADIQTVGAGLDAKKASVAAGLGWMRSERL